MAPFSLALLASMGLLGSDVAGVAIPIDKMMRTEKSEEFMEISAAGSMQSSPRLNDSPSTLATALQDNECRINYILGTPDTCACDDPANHHVILEEAKCRHAASLAGITAPDYFVIGEDWYNHHPRGCFKDKCSSDSDGQCYFFNPVGNFPAQCADPASAQVSFTPAQPGGSQPQVHGVPVCRRNMFEYGTTDANDGCPDGYERELDETPCSRASTCLSEQCTGPMFIVTIKNQSRHDDFPLGCFLNEQNCLQYNPQLVNWAEPSSPVGTPLCKAKPPSAHELSKTGGSSDHVENRVNTTAR